MERDYEDESLYNENFTVQHQRPITISRRIERAVRMNVTAKWASVPFQVECSTLIGRDPSRYCALIG